MRGATVLFSTDFRKLRPKAIKSRVIPLVSGRTGIWPRLPGSEAQAPEPLHYADFSGKNTQRSNHSPSFTSALLDFKGVMFYSTVDIILVNIPWNFHSFVMHIGLYFSLAVKFLTKSMWASNKVTLFLKVLLYKLFLKVLLYKPQSHRSLESTGHPGVWLFFWESCLEEVSPGWLVKLECVQRPAAVVCGDG